MTSPAEVSTETVTIPTEKELRRYRMMLDPRLLEDQAHIPFFEGLVNSTSHVVHGQEDPAMPSAETIVARLLRVSHG